MSIRKHTISTILVLFVLSMVFTAVGAQAQVGDIIIAKEAPGGDSTLFHFSGDLGAMVLADGYTGTFQNIPAGDYTVTEVVPSGWKLTDVTCVGGDSTPYSDASSEGVTIHLDAGEHIMCTFTNTQEQPPEPDVEIFKEQSLDNATWRTDLLDVEHGQTIFYKLTVTNLVNQDVVLTILDYLDNLVQYTDTGVWAGSYNASEKLLEHTMTLGAGATQDFFFEVKVADLVYPDDTLIENTGLVKLPSWDVPKPSNTVVARVKDPIPEPATIALLGTGLLGIFALVRRRRRQRK